MVLLFDELQGELFAEVSLAMKEESGHIRINSTLLEQVTPVTGPLVYYFIGDILIHLGHEGFDFRVNCGDFYLWKERSFDRFGFDPITEAEKTQQDIRFLAEIRKRFSSFLSMHLVMRKN